MTGVSVLSFTGAELEVRDLVTLSVLSAFLFAFIAGFADFRTPLCTKAGGGLGLAAVSELTLLPGALSLWLTEPGCALAFLPEGAPVAAVDFESPLGLLGATLFGRGLALWPPAACTPLGSFFLPPVRGDELSGCGADPLLAAIFC